jgi:glutamine---fructose-6-phosphate transaminase (isomerizing)
MLELLRATAERVIHFDETAVPLLLDAAWAVKRNDGFLRYFREQGLRSEIDRLANCVRSIDVSRIASPSVRDSIRDAAWILDAELPRWAVAIGALSGLRDHEHTDTSILFYKGLATTLLSIDSRLETRGRDSLGICVQLMAPEYAREDSTTVLHGGRVIVRSDKGYGLTACLRTASRIGALGDNAAAIRECYSLCRDSINGVLRTQPIRLISFVAHTRWASVGEVTVENCHPLPDDLAEGRLSKWIALNGDIKNYKELVAKSPPQPGVTTDVAAIGALTRHLPMLRVGAFERVLKQLKASSAAICVQQPLSDAAIFLARVGTQGLYIGRSADEIAFASDVYGLVDTCREYFALKPDQFVCFGRQSLNRGTFCVRSLNARAVRIGHSVLKTTNQTTRDVDRANHPHFFVKELTDTPQLVRKSIDKYIKGNRLCLDEELVSRLCNGLEDGRIDRIIFTGMGSCHTAAEVASTGFATLLAHRFPHLDIRAILASEGSAFLDDDELRTAAVVAFAQSGTTADTNAFIEHASRLGAITVAIANKRESDITFLVDHTLYIGDGRDAEVAVPATKSYCGHIFVAWLLTLSIVERFAAKWNDTYAQIEEVDCARRVDLLLTALLGEMPVQLISLAAKEAVRRASFFVTFDSRIAEVVAHELRIKMSECCYQTIACVPLMELLQISPVDSFIVVISNSPNARPKAEHLYGQGNHVVMLSDCIPKGITAQFRGDLTRPVVWCLCLAILCQYLSYVIARKLDVRSKIVEGIEQKAQRGLIGEAIERISVLLQSSNLYRNGEAGRELMDEIGKKSPNRTRVQLHLATFRQGLRRPIDTIKHQAKTITVGAVRKE